MKIGSSVSTDSFTPRKFIATIASTTAMHTYILRLPLDRQEAEIASAPLAIEIEIVST